MLPAVVVRTWSHVDCGCLRWKTTLYGPLVVVLARFVISDEIPEGSLIAIVRSNENFTSVDVNESPFENFTPLRRVHAQVLRFPTEEHLVASSGCGVRFLPGPAASRRLKIR